MTIRALFGAVCACALVCGSLTSLALAKDGEPDAVQEGAAQLAAVPAALAALEKEDLVTAAKPDLKAKVYFIFQSRSLCGICVREAPEIAAIYKKMKGKGAELIMINIDRDVESAKKWAAKAKLRFPMVAPTSPKARTIPFPFTGGRTLPCMVALDPDGNKLGEANGSDVAKFLGTWKELVKAQKDKEPKEKGKKSK